MIRNVNYESVSAAARALGVSQQTVSQAMDAGRLDWVGLSKPHGGAGAIALNSTWYRNCAELVKATGLPRSSVYEARLRGKARGLTAVTTKWGMLEWT